MPTALLAGLPLQAIARVKSLLSKCTLPPDWQIRYVESGRKYVSVSVETIEHFVGGLPDQNGPHIFGLTDKRGERAEVERRLTPHFRLRWLNAQPFVNQLPTIAELVQAAVAEEEEWRRRIMPADEKAALVLPAIFSTNCHDSGLTIWQRAMRWGAEANIVAAERLIERFTKAHFRPVGKRKLWVDDRGLVWNFAGARHGLSPVPRNWKFSRKLPDSFHFDVAHEPPRSYAIDDAAGHRHSASKGPLHHLNIDAHGFVR